MLKAILIDFLPLEMTKDEAKFRLEEAESLIKTYGGVVLLKTYQKKIAPIYKTYIGAGKIEDLKQEGQKLGANILIVNNELKPLQTYNLSEEFRKVNMKVWDRIDLILKIFQKHAETKEAQLEIELASLRHMGPRIYGMGMILSRQGGGIGGRGIGETNTEIMKRHIATHIKKIEQALEKSQANRELHRASRRRKNFHTVGIVGYTNVGKSSLLNALTKKGAYSADELFATLDTRVARLQLPDGNQVLLTDTIGFIQDLPPTLIKSFKSTLEETIEADLLLHVIDLSDPRWEYKIDVVNEVLGNLGAIHKPIIYVFNKIDLLGPKFPAKTLTARYARFHPTFTSTYQKTGLVELRLEIEKMLFPAKKNS
ncbi:GTPase HflX [Candidatus Peregrinibacteria bacterium]|nr:GTPase HflX [Candidatus Peregrinibacteria bacterium]